jgi:hypothetical protein
MRKAKTFQYGTPPHESFAPAGQTLSDFLLAISALITGIRVIVPCLLRHKLRCDILVVSPLLPSL